jgi:hypothetical protein
MVGYRGHPRVSGIGGESERDKIEAGGSGQESLRTKFASSTAETIDDRSCFRDSERRDAGSGGLWRPSASR